MYKDIYWNDNYKGREPMHIKRTFKCLSEWFVETELLYGSDIKYEIQYNH